MDLYNSEFLNLVGAFEEFKVKYIIVGGFATNYHGYNRTTGDIDFWIKDSIENRGNLVEALASIGYGRLESLMTAELIPGYCEIMLDNGLYADIMGYIHGYEQLNFDDCYQQAAISDVSGIGMRFLCFNHHLFSKKQSRRLKDQLDVEQLEAISSEE